MQIILVKSKNNPHWKLRLSKEDREFIGEKPLCQNCTGFINTPFYVCEDTKKWYCADCELAEIKAGEKDFCPYRNKEGHKHYCIKEVEEEEFSE